MALRKQPRSIYKTEINRMCPAERCHPSASSSVGYFKNRVANRTKLIDGYEQIFDWIPFFSEFDLHRLLTGFPRHEIQPRLNEGFRSFQLISQFIVSPFVRCLFVVLDPVVSEWLDNCRWHEEVSDLQIHHIRLPQLVGSCFLQNQA